MAKLAVLFPGMGYTADRSLLYFAGRLARNAGYELCTVNYGVLPRYTGDNMSEIYAVCLAAAKEQFPDALLTQYDGVLFIAKSVGTIAAAEIASASAVCGKIRLVLYTPLNYTFTFSFGAACAFTGTDDPWVGRENSSIASLAEEHGVPCAVYAGANHSLETPDSLQSIEYLLDIERKTRDFIAEA